MDNNNKILDYWPTPDFTPRPNQIKALDWIEQQDAKYIILELPVGCHLKGTQILMYNGTLKSVENIKIDDLLMGKDSTPRKVLELHQGKEMMYSIIPAKGDPFIVNENHILSLIFTNQQTSIKNPSPDLTENKIVNISVKEYLNKSNNLKKRYKLYRGIDIDFPNNKSLLIDPYVLGIFLGNESKALTYDLNAERHEVDIFVREKNSVIEDFKSLGMCGLKSDNKFIPNLYKTSSKENRKKLLAGLLDIDGHYDGTFQYVTKSFQLAEDIIFIVRSIGLAAYISNKIINGVTYKTISISGDLDTIPTVLSRKEEPQYKQKKQVNIIDFNIKKYNINNYYGFQVNGDNLYMLSDFTVTHNSGKSIIGLNLSKYLSHGLGSSFVLTPQRILQNQYEQDFKKFGNNFLASLHGKGNYKCELKKASCNVGSLVKPRCKICPFQAAKKQAVDAHNTVLNYKLALTSFLYTETFKKRNLMIMDEAHTLERHLVDFDSVDITYARCKKYDINFKIQRSIKDAMFWVKETYLPKIENVLSDMESEYEYLYEKAGSEISKKELNKLKELKELDAHVCEVLQMSIRTINYLNKNFVLVHDKIMFQFKRLTGAYSFRKILEPMANRFLFMSSTILNKTTFCNDLGINPKDTAFLSLESDFPVENRPIYYMPVMKMNASWNKPEQANDRKLMIDRVVELLNIHKDESGILHTANYQVAMWLVKELRGKISQEIYHHNPDDDIKRNDAISGFVECQKPSILISPSSTEGLDLKDDLARFAIIVKTPFGYLGDQWIKRRLEMSTEWYQRRAMTEIIQGGGRIVRSADDEAVVYILDGSFGYLYSQCLGMIPKWWKESFKTI